MEEQVSPTPKKAQEGQVLMNFAQAIQEIIDGKKVTRVEWNDNNAYGLLKDGFLMIYTNNEFHRWLVSDGDMLATDWIVLSESN